MIELQRLPKLVRQTDVLVLPNRLTESSREHTNQSDSGTGFGGMSAKVKIAETFSVALSFSETSRTTVQLKLK